MPEKHANLDAMQTSRHSSRCMLPILAALLCAPCIASSPGPREQVAVWRNSSILLDTTHPAAKIQQTTAAFIKVRFNHAYIPAGMTLQISSPDGRQVHRYDQKGSGDRTVSRAQGEDGVVSFSAMAIIGNTALLQLLGTADASDLPARVEVSGYLEGLAPANIEKRDSSKQICERDNKRPVSCYQATEPAIYDRSRPVALMLRSDGTTCTAWRAGPLNRLFTNHHCAETTDDIQGAEFWFGYQAHACDAPTVVMPVQVPGDLLLRTDEGMDYTLFTVKNFAAIEPFGYLGLDDSDPSVGTRIFIPGHPGGRLKEVAVETDEPTPGWCKIDRISPRQLPLYSCDTELGNSGSPVITTDDHRVIILHWGGAQCSNTGTPFLWIWPQVKDYFDGQLPGNDQSRGP